MSHRPTPGDKYALDLLLDDLENLNEWETQFVESLSEYPHWSIKQGEKFDELRSRYLGE